MSCHSQTSTKMTCGLRCGRQIRTITVIAFGGLDTLYLHSSWDLTGTNLSEMLPTKPFDSTGAPLGWFRNYNAAFTQTLLPPTKSSFNTEASQLLVAPTRYSFSAKLDRIHGAVADRRCLGLTTTSLYLPIYFPRVDPLTRGEI